MPSTKIKNNITNEWEVYGSTEASEIKIKDYEGNFQSTNVEGALREASNKINNMSSSLEAYKKTLIENTKTVIEHTILLNETAEVIEWLKVNGGGSGGTTAPIITSSFLDNTIVEKNTDVLIPIFFSSPNLGSGTLYIIVDGVEINSVTGIEQGNSKINIGKLSNLNNEVSIYVKDRANMLSNQLTWNIICGGIDLSIEFDQYADYTITDIISMQFTVTSASSEPIIMHMTVDYDSYEIKCNTGTNEYTFANLGVGVHKIALYITSGPYKTITKNFSIVVVNAKSLYVSSLFNGGTFEYGSPIPIDYRISKIGSETFTISLKLDDELIKTTYAPAGSYYWTLSEIEIGSHNYKIIVSDNYGSVQEITGNFEVIAGDYTPKKITTSGLIYRLNAKGRTNNDSDKTLPIDNSENGIKAELKNFNYFSNGWINDVLVCDGNAYVEIDCYPWADNAIYGSTIEIQFKGLDIGVVGSRILDYTDIETPYKGIYADLEEATMKSLANTGKVYLDVDEWITLTYVIDRKNKFGKIYIDGICSRAFSLSDTGSGTSTVREDFTHLQKIYLNSRKGQDKFGACMIKDLRVYNRVLTDDEILCNNIAQVTDLTEQKTLYDLNYNNKTLPTMKFYGDVSNMTLETPVTLRVKYTSPNEDKYGQSFDLPYCEVNWQGTSSLQYVLKNYTIKMKDANLSDYYYTPFQNGVLENIFCCKADYMESTHSRNTGLAKFVNACLYDEKNPMQLKNPNIRNAVDGFPMLLYINDTLQGVYNFNLDRYSTKSYGYTDENKCISYEVSANSDTTAGAFYKWTEASGKTELNYYKSDFECLYPPTRVAGNDSMTELIRLVRWVNDSSDEDFKSNISNYFNLQYLLRYFLYVYVTGAVDSLGKNMKLTTWDGLVWYPQIYDADTTIGLDNTGFLKFDMDIEMGDKNVFNTTGSKLWTRVQLLFKAELEQQYAIMRQKQFTVDNMMKYILEEQIEQIPAKFYNIDMQTKYLNYGSSYLYALHGSGYHHIRKWLRERLIYCDTLFGYNVSTSDYITLRSSKLGEVHLDIQTYIPMYVKIKWRDEANNTGTQVKRVGRGETIRFTYIMPTATDQEIIIYAGHYLKSLGNVSNLQPTSMLIANADRLTEITCHSPNLINTDLSECTLLQRIDLSDSILLGTGIGAQPILNIQNCKYLRYCNCMNTQLTAIYTMQAGGNLEELYFPKTTQVIQVTNQVHLHTLGIPYPRDESDNYCKNLATVQITNCNSIKYIQYPYIEDEGLKFESLKYVQNLSIVNSLPTLTRMSFNRFNKLKNISIQSLSNLESLGFNNLLGASEVSTLKSIELSNLQKITRIEFNVDSNNYKITFTEGSIINLGGLQSLTTIESNYSIKGLDTIILPTSVEEITFNNTYGDDINEIKNIWSATSNHFTDGFSGIDFQDMNVSFIDMSGLSQITNAINFNIAPIDKSPNMNANRDGTIVKPWFEPSGTINLNNYTGSMVNMFKGIDLSRLTIILDVDKIQTDLTGLFQNATINTDDISKINTILSKFSKSTIWDYMFAYSNLQNLTGITIGSGKMSLKGMCKSTKLTSDIKIPSNVIAADEMFMDCVKLITITPNWENVYDYGITSNNCYKGCALINLNEVAIAWGGYGFFRYCTGLYIVTVTDGMVLDLSGGESGNIFTTPEGVVDWGDGEITYMKSSHTYKSAGVYTIKGHIHYQSGNTLSKNALTSVVQCPTPLKSNFNSCVNLTSVDLSGTELAGDVSNLFKGCSSLSSIIGLSITSSCERTSSMFYNCTSLKNVDNMHLWDMSNIIHVDSMFNGCGISDFSGVTNWNFSPKLVSINSCFANTISEIIDISGWTKKLSYIPDIGSNSKGLFESNTNLKRVNVANLIKLQNTSVERMFANCTSLVEIMSSETWSTVGITNWNNFMFNTNVTTLNISGWSFGNDTHSLNDVFLESPLNKLIASNIIVLKNNNFNLWLKTISNLSSIVMNTISRSMTDFSGMFQGTQLEYDIVFPSWTTNVSDAFKDCPRLKHINSNWNGQYESDIVSANCYSGNLNLLTIDSIPSNGLPDIPLAWGGYGFFKEFTGVIEVEIPTDSYTLTLHTTNWYYERLIDWGDGTFSFSEDVIDNKISHTYITRGTYTLRGHTAFSGGIDDSTSNLKYVLTKYVQAPSNSIDYYKMFYNFEKATTIDLATSTSMSSCISMFENSSVSKVTLGDVSNCINCNSMFKNAINLVSVNNLNLTSNCTDIQYIFYGCKSLTDYLNFANWDVANVTNMSYAIASSSISNILDMKNWNISKVTSLDSIFKDTIISNFTPITTWNTVNVTNMNSMFYNCANLTLLNLSNLNTANVTSMSNMFSNCTSLTSLDLSSFNTSNVTNCAGMLYNIPITSTIRVSNRFTKTPADCSWNGTFEVLVVGEFLKYTFTNGNAFVPTTLTITGGYGYVDQIGDTITTRTLYATDEVSLPTVISFSGKTNLIQVLNIKGNLTSMNNMFKNCSNLTSLNLSNLNTSNVTDMTQMFYYCSKLTSLDLSNFDTSNATTMYSMFDSCSKLTSLDLSNFNTAKVTSMNSMFSNCSSLTSLDLSNFNTSNTTDTSYMFLNCSKLTSLDLSNFNTNNVTNMSYMFPSCSSLTSLNVSSFNTSKTKTMNNMFYYCSKLTSLDLSSFDTTNVTTMTSMFDSCSSLTSLDLSNFNTINVTNMSNMFSSCSKLTSLDLSSFNTINVTTMYYMFYNCTSLTSLDLSSFNTSKVTTMGSMFYSCSKLTSLDLSNFNTAKVTIMSSMFSSCSGLTSLNVSNFNTSNVIYTNGMFALCSGLTSLNLSNFNTSNVTTMDYMFSNCISLTSLDLSSFNTSNVRSITSMLLSVRASSTIRVSNRFTKTPADCSWNGTFEVLVVGEFLKYTFTNGNAFVPTTLTITGGYGYVDQIGDTITTRTLYATDEVSLPTVISFSGKYNLIQILNIKGNLTTMSNMFNNCTSLTSVNLSNLNTINVTSMNNMFYTCTGLTSVNLSNLNTINVTNMNNIFNNCSKLTSLDLSNFNTSSVTNMTSMFSSCSSLTSLDLSNFDTSNATTMYSMFDSCSKLTSLDLSNFNTAKVTSMNSMFSNCSSLTSLDLSNFITSNTTDTSYMFCNCSNLISVNLSNFNTTSVTSMCYIFNNCSKLTSLDLSSFITASVTNMTSMFSSCSSLTSLDLSNFDTSKVTSMSAVFSNCTSLTSLDLSSFNTSNVTSMNSMFFGCSGLTSLDLSNFITTSVIDMYSMFNNCSNLTLLKLPNFVTSSVTDMYGMFKNCSSLTSLDLSSFNTSNVTSMSSMFYNCTSLTSINLSNLNTANVTSMSNMFSNCTSLTSLDLSSFNTSNATTMYSMFYNCTSLTSINLSNLNTANVTSMSNIFSNCTSLTSLDLSSFNTSNVTNCAGMLYNIPITSTIRVSNRFTKTPADCSWNGTFEVLVVGEFLKYTFTNGNAFVPTTLTITGGYGYVDSVGTTITTRTLYATDEVSLPTVISFSGKTNLIQVLNIKGNLTSMNNMFKNCSNLTSLNLSNLNTSNVTDMSYMFYYCSGLTSVNLSSFNTTNVTSMNNMFYYCPKLTSLNLSNFNTSSVTNMNNMFYSCTGLTSLNLSNFNTSSVTSMNNMFYNCSNLTSLNLSNLNTSNVTDMSYMFYRCSGLTSLDLSSFDINSVTNMNYIFYGCSSLTSLDLSNFDTSNAISMSAVFSNCTSLTSLDLSNFNTSKATDINAMFSDCTGLVSINLSSFNTSNVTDMINMFYNCSSLTSLDLSSFNTSNVRSMISTFCYCSSLTSLDLSNFDTSKVTNTSFIFDSCSKLASLDLSNVNSTSINTILKTISYKSTLINLYLSSNVNIDLNLASYTNLTVDTLVSILNLLATITATQVFTLGATNLAKLTNEQKAIAINKGWTLA